MSKTPDKLIPALRQYRHNDGTGLFHGFDYDGTVHIFIELEAKVEALTELVEYTSHFVQATMQRRDVGWGRAETTDLYRRLQEALQQGESDV